MNGSRPAIAVASGAALGASVRWGIAEIFPQPTGWPWAVFVVNLIGSFALGIVLTVAHQRTDDTPHSTLRLAAGTGFCGALTTFSTFAVDIASFLRDDRLQLLGNYVLASIGVGIFAFVMGRTLAHRMVTT